MTQRKSSNVKTHEANIVVIGGGGAGLAACVAAAESGASGIVLLEKHRHMGGNTAAALDIFACESPAQKRENIDAPRDLFFKIAAVFTHWALDMRIIRAYLNKTGDTISWLEGKGLNFTLYKRKFTFFNQLLPPTAHNMVGTDGAGLIRVLAEDAENLGVRLLCDTQARELRTSEDKKFIDVIVSSKKDGETTIRTRSVIIATGGYGGNKEMLRQYCPYYNENISLCGFPNMGDGISMAMKMGAATEGLGMLHLESKGLPRQPKQMWLISWRPTVVWLNKRGERFTNEAIDNVFEGANPVLRQPDNISYTIFDEKIKQHIFKEMEEVIMPHYYGRKREKNVERWLPRPEKIADEDLETILLSAAKQGDAMISDSWGGIAKWIGADTSTLKATIDEYNYFCDKGNDEIFAKNPEYLMPLRTPPYYALKCGLRILGTIGGIKINYKMQVIDKEDKPIPGIYAAGIDTGGWEIGTYNQYLAGTTLGFAINSGRIAGENAAQYVVPNH